MIFGRILRWGLRLLGLVVLAAVVYFAVTAAQVLMSSTASHSATAVEPSRAIVVVGAPSSRHRATGELAARCDQALVLWAAHRAPLIFVTGGPVSSASGAPTEAALAAKCLEAGGVGPGRIVQVPEADLADALASVAGHFGGAGAASSGDPHVVLVAAPLQVLWLGHLAQSEGLYGVVSPALATKGSFVSDLGQIGKQTAAVALGRIVGYPRTVSLGN